MCNFIDNEFNPALMLRNDDVKPSVDGLNYVKSLVCELVFMLKTAVERTQSININLKMFHFYSDFQISSYTVFDSLGC